MRAFRITIGLITCTLLCGCTNDYQGSMTTQSGENVSVYRDQFYLFDYSKPYYYENGAKVYVNEGDQTQAPDRSTKWNGDR